MARWVFLPGGKAFKVGTGTAPGIGPGQTEVSGPPVSGPRVTAVAPGGSVVTYSSREVAVAAGATVVPSGTAGVFAGPGRGATVISKEEGLRRSVAGQEHERRLAAIELVGGGNEFFVKGPKGEAGFQESFKLTQEQAIRELMAGQEIEVITFKDPKPEVFGPFKPLPTKPKAATLRSAFEGLDEISVGGTGKTSKIFDTKIDLTGIKDVLDFKGEGTRTRRDVDPFGVELDTGKSITSQEDFFGTTEFRKLTDEGVAEFLKQRGFETLPGKISSRERSLANFIQLTEIIKAEAPKASRDVFREKAGPLVAEFTRGALSAFEDLGKLGVAGSLIPERVFQAQRAGAGGIFDTGVTKQDLKEIDIAGAVAPVVMLKDVVKELASDPVFGTASLMGELFAATAVFGSLGKGVKISKKAGVETARLGSKAARVGEAGAAVFGRQLKADLASLKEIGLGLKPPKKPGVSFVDKPSIRNILRELEFEGGVVGATRKTAARQARAMSKGLPSSSAKAVDRALADLAPELRLKTTELTPSEIKASKAARQLSRELPGLRESMVEVLGEIGVKKLKSLSDMNVGDFLGRGVGRPVVRRKTPQSKAVKKKAVKARVRERAAAKKLEEAFLTRSIFGELPGKLSEFVEFKPQKRITVQQRRKLGKKGEFELIQESMSKAGRTIERTPETLLEFEKRFLKTKGGAKIEFREGDFGFFADITKMSFEKLGRVQQKRVAELSLPGRARTKYLDLKPHQIRAELRSMGIKTSPLVRRSFLKSERGSLGSGQGLLEITRGISSEMAFKKAQRDLRNIMRQPARDIGRGVGGAVRGRTDGLKSRKQSLREAREILGLKKKKKAKLDVLERLSTRAKLSILSLDISLQGLDQERRGKRKTAVRSILDLDTRQRQDTKARQKTVQDTRQELKEILGPGLKVPRPSPKKPTPRGPRDTTRVGIPRIPRIKIPRFPSVPGTAVGPVDPVTIIPKTPRKTDEDEVEDFRRKLRKSGVSFIHTERRRPIATARELLTGKRKPVRRRTKKPRGKKVLKSSRRTKKVKGKNKKNKKR